jgi:hypothetical protein
MVTRVTRPPVLNQKLAIAVTVPPSASTAFACMDPCTVYRAQHGLVGCDARSVAVKVTLAEPVCASARQMCDPDKTCAALIPAAESAVVSVPTCGEEPSVTDNAAPPVSCIVAVPL